MVIGTGKYGVGSSSLCRFKGQCSLEHRRLIDGRSSCKYSRNSESDQYIISLQHTNNKASKKKKKEHHEQPWRKESC
jgi:hypothetical protein